MNPPRCEPDDADDLLIRYHDQQWGKPTFDDQVMFEFLVLESFQAGLSWNTILHKRAAFRQALDGFDYRKVAQYDQKKLDKLLNNEDIIRNQPKLEAAINNAQRLLDVREEHGSFARFIWSYVDNQPIDNQLKDRRKAEPKNALSERIAKDLKQREFQFIGPTIMYSFMEAMGLINNHEVTCFRYDEVKQVAIDLPD